MRAARRASRIESASVRAPLRLLLPIALSCAWCAYAVYRMSFDVDGERVFCLWDDAMISMTYARNLVEGHGLTWSRRGDAVEGFTHPLWVLFMVLVHLLPIAREHTSALIQILSAACFVGAIVETKTLAQRHFTPAGTSWLPATLAVALYYPLALWTMLGMETGLAAFLILRALRQALDVRKGHTASTFGFWLTASLATLLRMDLVIPVGLCGLALAASLVPATFRDAATVRRAFLRGLALFVTLNAAYLVFRLAYYGDILPNTYYLKMTGTPTSIRVLRGLEATGITAAYLSPILLFALLPAASRHLRLPGWPLAVTVLISVFGYSIWVGGDAWEWAPVGANRFIAAVMPVGFVAATGTVDRLRALIGAGRLERTRWLVSPTGFVLTAGMILVANGIATTTEPMVRVRQVLLIEDPIHHREHLWWIRRVRELERIFDDRATVAVEWAGVPAYFSNWRMCDELGYNDRHMAHGPNTVAITDPADFQPGHMKWDLDYVLRELQPDVMMDPWNVPWAEVVRAAEGNHYIRRHGYWVRPGSPYVGVDPQPP